MNKRPIKLFNIYLLFLMIMITLTVLLFQLNINQNIVYLIAGIGCAIWVEAYVETVEEESNSQW